ncbi:hypothetical protein GCM10025867_46030 (plasmid) [Frondihabitans sucicola]|uniref:Uncharacterized protein n=1 Tax=Frondihabitans sucicola TaxID=1268041 RepID=A0ABM8GV66_9MICO|nr:hypothetical protein [Frondihabitans sucicola]BDZ52362.1 hypothetical protein GCM10025867_46030 [Frondihabitans sucicola]
MAGWKKTYTYLAADPKRARALGQHEGNVQFEIIGHFPTMAAFIRAVLAVKDLPGASESTIRRHGSETRAQYGPRVLQEGVLYAFPKDREVVHLPVLLDSLSA